MAASDPKEDLQRYLQHGREALLWKLDGLSEYDMRRPMVRTGTNLLGLVKHIAGVETGYFGAVFGRPFPDELPFLEDGEWTEPNADMWAAPDETSQGIIDFYRRAWSHSDATIAALPLDAVGHVPHWPADRREVTLHRMLVHVIVDTHRHAGHADIVREVIDGAAGTPPDSRNPLGEDDAWWASYRAKLELAAQEAGRKKTG